MAKINELIEKRSTITSQIDVLLAGEMNDETRASVSKLEKEYETAGNDIETAKRNAERSKSVGTPTVDAKNTEKSLGLRWVEGFKEFATRGNVPEEFRGENGGMLFPMELRYDPLLSSSATGIINKTVGTPSVKTPAGLDFLRSMGATFDENLTGNYALPSIATVSAGFVTEGGDSSTFNVAPVTNIIAARPLGGNQSISKLVLTQTNPEILGGILKVINFAVEEAIVKDAFVQTQVDLTTARLQSSTVVAPSNAKLLAMDSSIAVSMLNPVYVMSKACKNYLKNDNAGSANIKFTIGDDNTVNGIPVFAHPSIVGNRIFLIDANDLHIGFWGTPELIIDNFSQKKSMRLEFQIQAQCDTGYANPASGVYYDASTMW